MDQQNKRRWLIKDTEGQVRGPFGTDEILKKISNGEVSGDEKIALYPGSEWISITQDPDFYDRLLELLELDRVGHKVDPRSVKVEDEDYIATPPPEIPKPKKNRAERVSVTNFGQTDEPPPASEKKSQETVAQEQPVIELKRRKKIVRKNQSKSIMIAVVLLAVAGFAFVYFGKSGNNWGQSRIHLLIPRKNRPPLTDNQVKRKQILAVQYFDQDNFSTYLRSEEQLVEILEGDPKNTGATALLCLNYLELWPYAAQDSHDLWAITSAVQEASAIDPAGNEAATCRVVDLMARGRYIEAKNLTETVLDTFAGSANPPIDFYFLKARLLDLNRDPSSAISYIQSAEQLWPQWLRLFSFEAYLQTETRNYIEAAKRYRAILKTNPQHKVSQIELGSLDILYLNDPQSGAALIKQAFSSSERAPQDVLARGYVALAELALKSGKNSTALRYAQLAYKMNSLNARAKEIILQLGGEKTLRDTHVEDMQLVYEGDQLVREGDFNSAQAHYKEAFKTNPKNGMAAMKAAECLWNLSLSSEAIEWLNKAIHADPNLIDAYVQLADYFSQRYNYQAAGQVLNQAYTQSPKSYKVMSGFALVELRRHDPKGAVTFAEKAIHLYEADVDSYVILTRAYIELQQYAKAFDAASHAVEIDINSREAQIAYAQALGGVRGAQVGIDYVNRLVSTYPSITEYRLALGDMYMKDQDYASAQKIYEQVVKIEDKPKKAYMDLGLALVAQGHYEEALTAYFNAAALDPADAEPLYRAGMLYLAAKKPTDAQEQFQRVLKVNKDYPLVNYQIGRAALMLNAPAEALEQAKIEKMKNPNLADPYILAADAYTAMGQYSLCASEYQSAVKLRPQGADMYIKMARCYRLAGDLDAAVSMINIAHDQESGNPDVWKEMGAIYETRGDRTKAIEAYNQYIVLAPNAPDRSQVQARIDTLAK